MRKRQGKRPRQTPPWDRAYQRRHRGSPRPLQSEARPSQLLRHCHRTTLETKTSSRTILRKVRWSSHGFCPHKTTPAINPLDFQIEKSNMLGSNVGNSVENRNHESSNFFWFAADPVKSEKMLKTKRSAGACDVVVEGPWSTSGGLGGVTMAEEDKRAEQLETCHSTLTDTDQH